MKHAEVSEMKLCLRNHIELHLVIAIGGKDLLGKGERHEI